jgi:hypothetical protein
VKKPLAPRFPLMRGESEKGWQAGRRGRVVGPAGSINKSPTSSLGGAPERGVAQLRGKSNLRGKKLDPWRGANVVPKAPAVLPIIGGDSQRNLSQGNSRR